jgi:hypothetical protein
MVIHTDRISFEFLDNPRSYFDHCLLQLKAGHSSISKQDLYFGIPDYAND